MNRTLAALLEMAGLDNMSASDIEAARRFRARQRSQPRAAGSTRRSAYELPMILGGIERGTRAKSRGPYPQHLIDNCNAMRARNGEQ